MKNIRRLGMLTLIIALILGMTGTALARTTYSESVALGPIPDAPADATDSSAPAADEPDEGLPEEELRPSEEPAALPPEADQTVEPDATGTPDAPADLATKAPSAAALTYLRDVNGALVLDENGDPVALVPEGAEIPLNYVRDENGELVLDENGDPIPATTLPQDATKISSFIDELNPDRYIDVYATYGEELNFGDTVTLIAVLYGYDNTTHTLQWQRSRDGGAFTDVDGANDLRYSFTLTEDNYGDYWRIAVVITDAWAD